MISPQDLKRNAFPKAIKGYSIGEVDEYIAFLIEKYTECYNNYQNLSVKYQSALDQLDVAKSEESAITATIVNAQKMADAIINDAKEKANNIRSSVSSSCEEILTAYREKVAVERDKLMQCENAVAEFKNSLYDAYKKHLALIDNIMPDEDVTPVLSDEELEDKAVALAEEKLKTGDAGEDMSNDFGQAPEEDGAKAEESNS